MICFEEIVYLFSCGHQNRGLIRLDLNEAALLYKYVKRTHGDIVEIGRKYGGSAVLIAAAMNDGQTIHSIDIVNHPEVESTLKKAGKEIADKIRLINGSSVALAANWAKELSLVFVDGDHSIEAVRRDVYEWGKFVEPNGYMVLHDIRNANLGLELVVDDMKENGWREIDCAGSLVVLQKEISK